jgi:signal transduction histidine kinase
MNRLGRTVRSVRVRITLAATLVTGVAVLLAGTWLVHTVEGSLTSSLRTEGQSRLAKVRSAIEQGRTLSELDLQAAGGAYLQVVVDGRVVASSPAGTGLPPLYSYAPDGGVIRIDQAPMALTEEVVDAPGGQVQLLAASPLDPVRRSVDAVQEGLAVSFPLLVGAVGLLAWVLAGRALRPVEAIRAEVEAITASTLGRRVPVPRSGDEVARLANTMNAMLDRLEDASTRQQRFVADASHELRSPVTAIRTELEVAQRTAGPADWPAVANRLLTEEARLEAVIADLLLLASLDEGGDAPDTVVVDLAELAQEEARRRAPDRDEVTIEVDAASPVLVRGSRMQLGRALANLLDNAGRHARGTVRVSVHDRDGRARLLVDDDGPGIPEADRERVFERFTRLDEHRARNGAAGAGLGLSLVRGIAERHSGTARVETAPLGGVRVVLDLPLSRSPR